MSGGIHEGRILVGLITMVTAALIAAVVLAGWWIPFALAGIYVLAYGTGAVVLRILGWDR